ncbi:MAG: outer membrane protein assembly factor BamE domain-containing protein [Achromobacter pestifer]
MKNLFAIIALSLLFSSAHAGTDFLSHESGIEVTQDQFASVEIGRTQKQDVVTAIGHPSRKEQLGDNQTWYYDYAKIRSFGKNVSEATVFEFNKDGVVIEKYKTGGKAGNPLTDAAR